MVSRDVRELLEPGEDVEESVELGDNRVVVTNRRVLAFTPDGPGKRYRALDRPNVTGVDLNVRSDPGLLINGGSAVLGAVVLVVAARSIDTDGLLPDAASGQGASVLGVGGFISQLNTWIGMIDDAMLYGGILALLVGVVYAARFVHGRTKVLSLEVAGEDDVDLPAGDVPDPREQVDELRVALDFAIETGDGDQVETEPVWR